MQHCEYEGDKMMYYYVCYKHPSTGEVFKAEISVTIDRAFDIVESNKTKGVDSWLVWA
jgi:hypothetical protein